MIMGKQKRTTNGILNIIQRFPYCEVMEAVIQTQNRIEIGMIGGINANGGANKNPLKFNAFVWYMSMGRLLFAAALSRCNISNGSCCFVLRLRRLVAIGFYLD